MNTLHTLLTYYILCINAVTFIIYGIDKYKAKKAKWRIPEVTLLMIAVMGGSIGAWLGMKVWHHKTMHKKFKYGVPVILFRYIFYHSDLCRRLRRRRGGRAMPAYREAAGWS